MRLGKQARDDGAFDSDNVLGDVVESLIGALYLEAGFETATAFVRAAWGERVNRRDKRAAPSQVGAPGMGGGERPQGARLSSWPAAPARSTRRPSSSRSRSSGVGAAEAEGTSKQEAETAAAAGIAGAIA